MSKIPVNFLDVVKYKLQELNAPQYFFQFWQFIGDIKHNNVQEAFSKTYAQIEKTGFEFVKAAEKMGYQSKQYTNNCIYEKTSQSCNETLVQLMEERSVDIVKKSNFAPVVLVHIENGNSHVFLLMINHIFADGGSGYLFFEYLVKNYNALVCNKNITLPQIKTIGDDEFLKQIKAGYSLTDKIKYFLQLIKQIKDGLYHKSKKNIIRKIYNEQKACSKVHYSFTTIKKSDINVKGYSSNTILGSAIIKAFLELKGEKINNTVSVAVPVNVRNTDQKIFGNYVSSISIKVENSTDMPQILQTFQKRIDEFKNPYRPVASYALAAMLGKKKSPEELLDIFRTLSSKHHFYISNYGRYNHSNDTSLNISDCEFITSGGFNFPLQANYGLIFTLVPYNDEIGLSISTSPLIADKIEIKQLVELIKTYLQD